ncbi:MAG: PrsW family glutamic-type intramembrane protease, partial [Candidatus Izemoplasmatales bacterium]
MNAKKMGKQLYRARMKANVSYEELSVATEIPVSLLKSYEIGKSVLRRDFALRISHYLQIDPYVFGYDIEQTLNYTKKNIFQYFGIHVNLRQSGPSIKRRFQKRKKEIQLENRMDIFENQIFHPEKLKPGISLTWKIAISLVILTLMGSLAGSIVLSNFAFAMVVPITLLWLLFESHHPKVISGIDLIKYFMVGGALSIILVYFLTAFSGVGILLGNILTGLVEEAAKILAVLYLARKRVIHTMLEGMLIGFAVGAGFTVFETTMYGMWAYLDPAEGGYLAMMETIGFRSLFDIFGIGHHFWASMLAGIVVSQKRFRHVRFDDFTQFVPMMWYLVFAAIHALWNTFTISWAGIGVMLFSGLLFLVIWTKANQDYHTLLKERLIAQTPKEGIQDGENIQ